MEASEKGKCALDVGVGLLQRTACEGPARFRDWQPGVVVCATDPQRVPPPGTGAHGGTAYSFIS